jgi:predicted nucleic acid-binding protein
LRILVDTSVWADFFNNHPSPEQRALADLFTSVHEICTCGVVVAEVFQGLHRDEGRARLAELFWDLTFLEPGDVDFYFRAADLYRALRRQGKTIRSTIDCIIAVLAEEHGCAVLARDRDMETIHASGLLTVGPWPVEKLSS